MRPGGGCQKIHIMLRKYVLYKKIMIETDLVLSECRKGMFKSVQCTFKLIVQENTLVHSKLLLSA